MEPDMSDPFPAHISRACGIIASLRDVLTEAHADLRKAHQAGNDDEVGRLDTLIAVVTAEVNSLEDHLDGYVCAVSS
jgi:hypothetical protein